MKMNWIILSVLGLISLSMMSFLITFLTRKDYPVSFVLFAITLVLVIGYFFQTFIFSHQTFTIDSKLIILLLIMGVFSYFGNLFAYQAANDAPNAGLAIAIVGLSGILVAILSVIFLKDKLNTIQIFGIILGVLAMFLITFGSNTNNAEVKSQIEDVKKQTKK